MSTISTEQVPPGTEPTEPDAPTEPTEPDAPTEPPEPDTDGPADDDAPDLEPDEEPDGDDDDEPDEEPAGPPAAPDTESALEAVSLGLAKRAKNYGSSIAAFLGDDWHGLVPCPLCSDHFPGILTPAPPTEATVQAVRPIIGLPDLSSYAADTYARKCERCQGRGRVLTGSSVPEYATMKCNDCQGVGFRTAETGAAPPSAAVEDAPMPPPTHADEPTPPPLPPAAIEALEKMLAAAHGTPR